MSNELRLGTVCINGRYYSPTITFHDPDGKEIKITPKIEAAKELFTRIIQQFADAQWQEEDCKKLPVNASYHVNGVCLPSGAIVEPLNTQAKSILECLDNRFVFRQDTLQDLDKTYEIGQKNGYFK